MKIGKDKDEWGAFHYIKCNSKDSKRNHQVAASISQINTKVYLRRIVDLLVKYPEVSVAEIFSMGNPPAPGDDDEDLYLIGCSGPSLTNAILYSDFSLLIYSAAKRFPSMAYPNIFEFIDSKAYGKYHDEHPVHDLISEFRQQFGAEHVAWWGGLNPNTGKERTDDAWLALVKEREQS